MTVTKKPGPVFEEPAPRRKHDYDWGDIATKCRANPGKSIKVYDNDRATYAESIRNGGVAVFRDPGFTITTRKNHTRKDTDGTERRFCSLFIRYNAPSKEKK